MSKGRGFWCVVLMLACLVGCKPGTPKQYIQPGKMEDILVDYHLARALADMREVRDQMEASPSYTQALLLESVLKKYGVTHAQFDSSLVYYYTRSDRFKPIYERVAQRLEERALTLGASEGEIGKYANAKGDTANVWADRSQMLLLPRPPYNRVDFEIEGDSLFWQGDKVLFQFMADYMVQTGSKNAVIYMAYEMTDTVVARSQRFSSTGLVRLEYQSPKDQQIKALNGYILFPEEDDKSTTAHLLFINNIQLVRFHTKKNNEKSATTTTAGPETLASPAALPAEAPASPAVTAAQDSLSPVAAGRPPGTDAGSSGDTAGVGRAVVSAPAGAGPHRVPVRVHQPQTR